MGKRKWVCISRYAGIAIDKSGQVITAISEGNTKRSYLRLLLPCSLAYKELQVGAHTWQHVGTGTTLGATQGCYMTPNNLPGL